MLGKFRYYGKISFSITQQYRNYWNLEGKRGTKVEFIHLSSDSGFGRQRDNCPQLKTQTVARKGRGKKLPAPEEQILQ